MRRENLVARSFCQSQQRCRFVANETLKDVSVESHRDVLVVRLHDVTKERDENVSKVCKNDLPLVCLYGVSNQSQMKYPMTPRWYVSTTCLNYVSTTLCEYVSTTFSTYIAMTSNWKVLFNSQIIVGVIGPYSSQRPNFSRANLKENQDSNLDYKIAELILLMKTNIYINNMWICHIIISKTTYR